MEPNESWEDTDRHLRTGTRRRPRRVRQPVREQRSARPQTGWVEFHVERSSAPLWIGGNSPYGDASPQAGNAESQSDRRVRLRRRVRNGVEDSSRHGNDGTIDGATRPPAGSLPSAEGGGVAVGCEHGTSQRRGRPANRDPRPNPGRSGPARSSIAASEPQPTAHRDADHVTRWRATPTPLRADGRPRPVGSPGTARIRSSFRPRWTNVCVRLLGGRTQGGSCDHYHGTVPAVQRGVVRDVCRSRHVTTV